MNKWNFFVLVTLSIMFLGLTGCSNNDQEDSANQQIEEQGNQEEKEHAKAKEIYEEVRQSGVLNNPSKGDKATVMKNGSDNSYVFHESTGTKESFYLIRTDYLGSDGNPYYKYVLYYLKSGDAALGNIDFIESHYDIEPGRYSVTQK